MNTIYSNLKKGEIKVKVENLDDLWVLSSVIEPDDLVRGKTIRKIKIGEANDRNPRIIKKPVFIEIKVENVEFHEYSSVLRVSGVIINAPEDIPKGDHHTFNVEENTVITIIKEKWLSFQVDKIKQASVETKNILICVLDRDNVCFGLLKKKGFSVISEIKGDVEKKIEANVKTGNFYSEIIKIISEYDKRYNPSSIIIASPAFWKEDLMKNLKDDAVRKKVTLATCSCSGQEAVNEVLKRPEVRNILTQQRVSNELKLVDELLEQISKNNLAAYGLNETEKAVESGAVSKLLVSEKIIHEMRKKKTYKKLEVMMKNAESMKAQVHLIGSDHEGGKKLDGLGGVGAILRYKLNY
jgi:protein pelota